MIEGKRCQRCGVDGPVTFVRQGEQRVGLCANQHKVSAETIGRASCDHQRLSLWIRRLERSTWRESVRY